MTGAAALHSCIYRGRVSHRRRAPVAHRFGYRLFMVYLDLDELDRAFRGRWLWSVRRPNLAWFRRGDLLGDPRRPLRDAVLDRVAQDGGARPAGPVRVLTHLRYFGLAFNPVSFYYCFAADGETLEAVVAEITNTPWLERHAQVLRPDRPRRGGVLRFRFAKSFHVSPFLPMEHDYDWRLTVPGATLTVAMCNLEAGRGVHDAVLHLQRRELGGRELARSLCAHPFMTGKVVAAIYWQALLLWWKGAPFFAHPERVRPAPESQRP